MVGSSVLLIDDDAFLRGALKELLEADGFEVTGTSEASQGYSMARSRHFDLMITDIVLPDIDGIEFIRMARERADLSDVPIVAISGYDRNYLVAAISAGADEALHKPEELDKIVDTAKKLTRKRSAAP
jgi:DNA-binding response OmpR family regulator